MTPSPTNKVCLKPNMIDVVADAIAKVEFAGDWESDEYLEQAYTAMARAASRVLLLEMLEWQDKTDHEVNADIFARFIGINLGEDND